MKMRGILFRAKPTEKNHNNNEWIEGHYAELGRGDGKEYYIIQNNSLAGLFEKEEYNKSFSDYQVDPETVCQYTDSISIGGNKIFEHDIVEKDGAIGIVKFGKYGNGFHIGYYIDWINFPHFRNELHFWEGRVRIIGNIFDNPELIQSN